MVLSNLENLTYSEVSNKSNAWNKSNRNPKSGLWYYCGNILIKVSQLQVFCGTVDGTLLQYHLVQFYGITPFNGAVLPNNDICLRNEASMKQILSNLIHLALQY